MWDSRLHLRWKGMGLDGSKVNETVDPRREATQRMQVMWTGRSSDEEFRNTDEMAAITAVISPDVYPIPEEKPTLQAGPDAMPLPDAIDVSGILSWQPDRLLELVPPKIHTLRFHRRIYDGVDAEGVVSLLRRGVLLGMDVQTEDGWRRVVDAPTFAPLVDAFENETERVMERLDVRAELETLEDLNSTSDITRPFDPGPLFAYDQVDALFADELPELPPTQEMDAEDDPEAYDEPPTVEFAAPLAQPESLPLPAIETVGQTQVTRSALIAAAMADAPASKPVPTAQIASVKNPRETEPNLRQPMPTLAASHQDAPSRTWNATTTVLSVLVLTAAAWFIPTWARQNAQPTEITAPLETRQAFVEASRRIRSASALPSGGFHLLAPAAEQWAPIAPGRAAALQTRLFDQEPRLERSLDIARLHAADGNFTAARHWLREATYLGAEAKVVVPKLREAIENDPTLRATPQAWEPPALTTFLWDANQRLFQVVTHGQTTHLLVTDPVQAASFVAEARVCEIMACAHRVPKAHLVTIRAEALPGPLPHGVTAQAERIRGVLVESMDLKVERAPIELKTVWASWLNADQPAPAGPYAARLLAWDDIDPDLRPDFAEHASARIDAHELTRQVASLFVTDFLTANTARDTRGSAMGLHTGFDGSRLVTQPAGRLRVARQSSGMRARLQATQRLDTFSFYALQAMTPTAMHGILTDLDPPRRATFERARLKVVDHFETLLDEYGSQQILLPR